MQTARFNAPALFGDHHVMEVRRILLEMGGVKDVYASSGFQVIEVTYDPKQVEQKAIENQLREAGYLGELSIESEPATADNRKSSDGNFRHTAVYEAVKGTVAFTQHVQPGARALWPCPGFGKLGMEK